MDRDTRKPGRSIADFSPLFFSGPAAVDPAPAPERDSLFSVRNSKPAPLPQRPRTLFITAFRPGSGKTFIAARVAHACRQLGCVAHEWQVGAGVIVPRRNAEYGLPIPHPSDRTSFDELTQSWADTGALILDGPISLISTSDPYALSAEEYLVVVLPGREGAAEGYSCVKEIHSALPDARIRILVNRAARPAEAQEAFHRVSDVCVRYLGRQVRSYGGLATFTPPETPAAEIDTHANDPVFSRIARMLATRPTAAGRPPYSYFDAVWSRQTTTSG
ncbi:MAG: hypothetical protein ACKVU1_17940 [bacterium]